MELVLAYGAGLLTLINPCVLPVLPLVIGSALQGDRLGPVALAAGMATTFVVLGVAVSAIGPAFGIDEHMVSQIGAVFMVLFGLVLIVPAFSRRFAAATAGLSGQADERMNNLKGSGLTPHFLAGSLLGAVWTPCVGPTLGGALALASQGSDLVWAGTIMTFFALGVSTVILALSYGTREIIMQRQAWFRTVAEKSRTIMGALLITVGIAIYFGLHYRLEGMLLDVLPIWLQDLSVAL